MITTDLKNLLIRPTCSIDGATTRKAGNEAVSVINIALNLYAAGKR